MDPITNTSLTINIPRLTPLDQEFSLLKGTDIQEALKLFKTMGSFNMDALSKISLNSSSSNETQLVVFSSVDNTSQAFNVSNLTKAVEDLTGMTKETMQMAGGSGWNAIQLFLLAREVIKNSYFENRQIVHLTNGNVQTKQEILQDIHKQITNTSLKAAVCFLRTIKVGTLFLDPQTKEISQKLLDGAAHAIGVVIHTVPQKPEFQRNPQNITWKDTAHQVFKVSVSVLGFAASVYNLAIATGYGDKEDALYKITSQLAMATMVTDIGYGLLQTTGLFQKRNY